MVASTREIIASHLPHGFTGLAAVVGLAAFLLYLRDRIAKAQGKTVAQVNARLFAILQFRSTLERCVPCADNHRRSFLGVGPESSA